MLELWKPVAGYEGLYMVSNQGRVKSLRLGRVLKPGLVTGGRWAVILTKNGKRKNFFVSHLVATAFLGSSEGRWVLHRNDIATDNREENLKYGTPQDNSDDRIKNGHSPRGSKHPLSKLTEVQVISIKTRVQTESYKALAAEFGVSKYAIHDIRHGRTWGWL